MDTEKIVKKMISPFEKFLNIESFSGLLLFGSAIIALVWANSPFSDIYENIKSAKISFSIFNFELAKPLILWINDGLMAIFFFLIGLEVKREIILGELNTFRKAILPGLGAIGGIAIPVLLFVVLNNNPETESGWGIPMATDIAFSLAVLHLLGKRVPLGLKIFLTALAIVDDIGAVLTIALFYSSDISWDLLAYSGIPYLILIILGLKGKYIKTLVFALSFIMWILFLKSGIHPTLVGILVAFTIPLRKKVDINQYTKKLKNISQDFCNSCNIKSPILTTRQMSLIDDLEDWTESVQSPVQYLEHKLHTWIAFLIIPVFALANSGVAFSTGSGIDYNLSNNIALSLILGKAVGISFFSILAIKLKLADLPRDVSFIQIIGVSFLAGIGFTMSIFISNLAFENQEMYINASKIGIITGSVISGLVGFLILRFSKNKKQ